MSRGTKLFQAPGSPLIQGRSRQARPWWQPYVAAVVLGLLWPIASMLPLQMADLSSVDTTGAAPAVAEGAGPEGLARFGRALWVTLEAWASGLLVLVPAVLVGAAIGVGIGSLWGMRFRWVPGAIGAIGTWYAALVVVGLFG